MGEYVGGNGLRDCLAIYRRGRPGRECGTMGSFKLVV